MSDQPIVRVSVEDGRSERARRRRQLRAERERRRKRPRSATSNANDGRCPVLDAAGGRRAPVTDRQPRASLSISGYSRRSNGSRPTARRSGGSLLTPPHRQEGERVPFSCIVTEVPAAASPTGSSPAVHAHGRSGGLLSGRGDGERRVRRLLPDAPWGSGYGESGPAGDRRLPGEKSTTATS